MRSRITGVVIAIVLCAVAASAQTTTSTTTTTNTGEHRTTTTRRTTTTTKYTGCLGGTEGSYTLAVGGKAPVTYTVVAAPGDTIDFAGDVSKRVEIVTVPNGAGHTTTTTTTTTSSTNSAATPESSGMNSSHVHTLTVQSIRVMPGACSSSTTTTTTTHSETNHETH
jgi:hypothetical protein